MLSKYQKSKNIFHIFRLFVTIFVIEYIKTKMLSFIFIWSDRDPKLFYFERARTHGTYISWKLSNSSVRLSVEGICLDRNKVQIWYYFSKNICVPSIVRNVF